MKFTRKKIVITAAAVLLTAGVGIACAFGLGRTCATGEFNDSLYPCSWAEQKNGSIVLSFTGELPENSTWIAMTGSDAIEVEQQEDEAVFTVKPRAKGLGRVWIILRESDAPMPQGEDYEFTFSVEKRMLRWDMTFCDASAKTVAVERYQTDSGWIYWDELSNGRLIFKADDVNWYAESLTGVTTVGNSMSGNGAGLEVIALEGGTERSMILRHAESGNDCKVSFSYTDGVLSVTECAAVPKPEEAPLSAVEAFLAEQAAEKAESGEEISITENTPDDLEALLQEMVRKWTEKYGKEPDETELEELRKNIFRG